MTETGGRRSRESLDWLVEGVLVGDATGCRAAGAPSAEGADSASTGWRDQSGLWGTNVTGCQPLQESLAAVEIAGWGRDWMHTYSIQGAGRREPPLPCVLKVRSL